MTGNRGINDATFSDLIGAYYLSSSRYKKYDFSKIIQKVTIFYFTKLPQKDGIGKSILFPILENKLLREYDY
jgi:hypothetical protein